MKAKHIDHFTCEAIIDSWGAQVIRIIRGDWIDCSGCIMLLRYYAVFMGCT